MAVAHEGSRLAARAETQRFELEQDDVREAVVHLEELHVGRRNTGHRERARRSIMRRPLPFFFAKAGKGDRVTR